jgi:hypothetical protein
LKKRKHAQSSQQAGPHTPPSDITQNGVDLSSPFADLPPGFLDLVQDCSAHKKRREEANKLEEELKNELQKDIDDVKAFTASLGKTLTAESKAPKATTE